MSTSIMLNYIMWQQHDAGPKNVTSAQGRGGGISLTIYLGETNTINPLTNDLVDCYFAIDTMVNCKIKKIKKKKNPKN